MAKNYHCIASKFGAGPLADFCATYYVVLTGFGNHWDDVRSNDYDRIRLLPPKLYAKRSSFRLFWLRRYLEKGLELMEFNDALRLRMFELPKSELQHHHQGKLSGIVIDSWTRVQGEESHSELIIYSDREQALHHLSCPSQQLDKVLTSGKEPKVTGPGSFRLITDVELSGYDTLSFISRIHVANRSHIKMQASRVPPRLSSLRGIVLAPKAADSIAHSVCSLANGELTFEPFSLYQSDDPKHLSELCFYSVEVLIFGRRAVDPDNHLQALLTCTDNDGSELQFRAAFNRVRRLKEGDTLLALSKRIWNTSNRFILEIEIIDKQIAESFERLADENYKRIQTEFVFTDAQELLALLPEQGAEYPVANLSKGQWVMHPDYGTGMVEGFEETEHGRMARFHFSGRRFEEVRIKIPASSTLPAYWTDMILLDA